jgi:hypothetical protein
MGLKTKLRIKSKTWGNTYDVIDEKTGQEFTINEYPERDRHPRAETAKYAVHEKYGDFLGKTKTLHGAKRIILEKVS